MMMLVILAVTAVLVILAVTAVLAVLVVMLMLLMALLLKLAHCILQCVLMLYCGKYRLSVKIVPRSRYDNGIFIIFAKKLHRSGDLLILGGVRMRKDYRRGAFDLIVKKLAEVLHIHLAFIDIDNGGIAAELRTACPCVFNRSYNVGKLSYSGGLDKDPVRVEFIEHLYKCRGKIAHERAADAAGIHFGDLYAGILQKSAVDTDLAELVLDEDELFTRICLFYKLFN